MMRWILLVLAVLFAAMAIFASFRVDSTVREAVVESQGNKKKWRKTADYTFHSSVRKYGDWPWLMLAGGAGALFAWRSGRPRWTRILMAGMLGSTLAGIVANASRLTTGRTRPRSSPKIEQGFYGPWHNGKLLIGDSAYNSFPSGHTATAFGFAATVTIASPPSGLIALPLAAVIAWSSIMMGAHHPSDITVSILLSIPIAWISWILVRDYGDPSLAAIRSWISKKWRRE